MGFYLIRKVVGIRYIIMIVETEVIFELVMH